MQGLDEPDRRTRRLFRTLDDDRAPGGQRGGYLAYRLRDRKIPWRERRDRSDRLHDDHVAHAIGARGDDATVGALPFAGIPVEDIAGALHLEFGLHEDFTLFLGQHLGDLIGAGAHQICGLAQYLAALKRGHFRPRLAALSAAVSALSRSPLEACPSSPIGLLVAGLMTSWVLAPDALTQLPSM